MSDDKNLAFAIASWLSSQSTAAGDVAKLKEASKLVSEAYGIDVNSAQQKSLYGKGPGLKNVWDVFMKTQAKMGGGAAATTSEASSGAESSSKTVSDEDKAKAEQLKGEGNKAMSAKDYGAAIDAYTKAIEIHPTNPVYFSNRSAAYAQIQQHDDAIDDAREASRVDPKFGKAYSRLGHALFSSGRYDEAVQAYEKGVEVDPSNALMKSGLETARQHAAKSSSAPSSSTSAPAAAETASRDVGDAAGGGGAGGFPGMGGGAGGMPDLSAMMNNPMIAQMAQNMMANGGLEQMMNNPMIQQMMSRFGGGGGAGGGGGMPDINALMQDPQMRDLARSFMGGAGGPGAGGAGAGRGAGRGSGGGNAGDDMFS